MTDPTALTREQVVAMERLILAPKVQLVQLPGMKVHVTLDSALAFLIDNDAALRERVETLDKLTTMQDGGIRDLHTQIADLTAKLAAVEQENTEKRFALLLSYRGIDKPCEGCGGMGTKAYGSTATWHHGIGGQSVTTDVCNKCWGSGDHDKPWRSWRQIDTLQARLATVEGERNKCESFLARIASLRIDETGTACFSQATDGRGIDAWRVAEQVRQWFQHYNERLATVEGALQGILDIGKRDMTNVKYDGFFESARAALHGRPGEEGKT